MNLRLAFPALLGRGRGSGIGLVVALVCGATLVNTSPARAQTPPGDSPRATVREVEGFCEAARYDSIPPYLDMPHRIIGSAAQLGHRLCDVIFHVRLDANDLSSAQAGDTDDDLPADRETVGTFDRPGGARDPIVLTRQKGTPSWRFSRSTVALVDTWYALLPARWLVGHLPRSWLNTTIFGLQRWQLVGIPLGLLFMVIAGVGLSWITRKIIIRVRGESIGGEPALARPIGFLWGAIVGRALLAPLGLPASTVRVLAHVLTVCIWLAACWTLAAAVEGVRSRLARAPWSVSNPGSRALLQLASRSIKLVLFLCAVIGALAQVGLPVGSLLAGLGVGGLGLALAAQKTVENLFGAFSIGVDQPFREGDYITVDNVSGTVERIGLRSTRLRTLERTIVAIPNGKLADQKTENFTVRDRFRLAATLSLSYTTTANQVRQIIDGTTRLIKTTPKVYTDVSVRLRALSTSSIDVDVAATFQAGSADEFLLIRQDVLLGLMAVVESAGSSLATPPSTIRVINDAPMGGGNPQRS
ncbi:MAG: mechanosensitive ion channel family protein [Polyangia bacterium]